MTGINRRTALTGFAAATMLAGTARAQRGDPSLAQIKTTDLGHKTFMLEGQGGNILVVISCEVPLIATACSMAFSS